MVSNLNRKDCYFEVFALDTLKANWQIDKSNEPLSHGQFNMVDLINQRTGNTTHLLV